MIRITTSTSNEAAFVELISKMLNSELCEEIIIITNDDKKNPKLFDLEDNIQRILKEMAISPNLNGYKYIIKSLEIIAKAENEKLSLSKEIYPEVARHFRVPISRVERGIRHAVCVSFQKGNKRIIEEIFGRGYSDGENHPTNSQFIYTLAERVN